MAAWWEGLSGRYAGRYGCRIEDLSLGGCFVNTSVRHPVVEGEFILVALKLPSGGWLQLRGEVVSCQVGLGFGVVFSFVTDEEEEALRLLLSRHSR